MKEADEMAVWNMPVGAVLPLVIDGTLRKYRVVRVSTEPGWIYLETLK